MRTLLSVKQLTIFLMCVRHSVNCSYSFEDIRLKFSVYIHIDLRKCLNYFAAKSKQKNSIVYKAFLLLGGIELTLNITFKAEKSYRLLTFGLKIKKIP